MYKQLHFQLKYSKYYVCRYETRYYLPPLLEESFVVLDQLADLVAELQGQALQAARLGSKRTEFGNETYCNIHTNSIKTL